MENDDLLPRLIKAGGTFYLQIGHSWQVNLRKLHCNWSAMLGEYECLKFEYIDYDAQNVKWTENVRAYTILHHIWSVIDIC